MTTQSIEYRCQIGTFLLFRGKNLVTDTLQDSLRKALYFCSPFETASPNDLRDRAVSFDDGSTVTNRETARENVAKLWNERLKYLFSPWLPQNKVVWPSSTCSYRRLPLNAGLSIRPNSIIKSDALKALRKYSIVYVHSEQAKAALICLTPETILDSLLIAIVSDCLSSFASHKIELDRLYDQSYFITLLYSDK